MSTSYENYPKGRVSVEGGELMDCYDVNLAFEDGETDVHTLRSGGMAVGSTGGKRKATATFKSAISSAGFERDYFGKWERREAVQLRLKVPGKTFTIEGRYRQPKVTSNVDNFVDFEVTIGGKFSFS